MDRVIISIAIIPISTDFGWSPVKQARVLSSIFVGYLLTHLRMMIGQQSLADHQADTQSESRQNTLHVHCFADSWVMTQ